MMGLLTNATRWMTDMTITKRAPYSDAPKPACTPIMETARTVPPSKIQLVRLIQANTTAEGTTGGVIKARSAAFQKDHGQQNKTTQSTLTMLWVVLFCYSQLLK